MNSFSSEICTFLDQEALVAQVNGDQILIVEKKVLLKLVYPKNHVTELNIHTQRADLEMLRKKNKVLHIWEDQWRWHNTILKNRIRSLCGLLRRLTAKNMRVVEIGNEVAQTFINTHHILGYTTAYKHLALVYKHGIVAVASFGKPLWMKLEPTPYYSATLIRFCTENGLQVVGGLSKLLDAFCALEPECSGFMTYADIEWSDGNTFSALGFELVGYSEPILYIVEPHTGQRKRISTFTNTGNMIEGPFAYTLGNEKYIKRF